MADDGEGQVSCSRGIMNETSRPIADLDIADVIRALAAAGAATVPGILGDEARRRLVEEARAFPFIAAPAVVGPYGVRQRYAAVTSFPPGSGFRDASGSLPGAPG